MQTRRNSGASAMELSLLDLAVILSFSHAKRQAGNAQMKLMMY